MCAGSTADRVTNGLMLHMNIEQCVLLDPLGIFGLESNSNRIFLEPKIQELPNET